MPAKIEIPPDLLAEGRFLYEETLTPVNEIWAHMGLTRSTFFARLHELGWVKRRYCPPAQDTVAGCEPAPPAPEGGGADATKKETENKVTPALHAALSMRVYDAMQKQMDAIESIQRTLRPGVATQSERTARILAILNKALREIAAITKSTETTPPDAARNDPVPTDNDPVPADIDEFRYELARRIKGLVESERGGTGEGSGGAPTALAG